MGISRGHRGRSQVQLGNEERGLGMEFFVWKVMRLARTEASLILRPAQDDRLFSSASCFLVKSAFSFVSIFAKDSGNKVHARPHAPRLRRLFRSRPFRGRSRPKQTGRGPGRWNTSAPIRISIFPPRREGGRPGRGHPARDLVPAAGRVLFLHAAPEGAA